MVYLVSILVLVDVPLKLVEVRRWRADINSFNPCFGGCSIKTFSFPNGKNEKNFCFNPCFGGCSIKTEKAISYSGVISRVSILVLVDVPLKLNKMGLADTYIGVSILVLVDVPLKLVFFVTQNQQSIKFQSLFWWMFH